MWRLRRVPERRQRMKRRGWRVDWSGSMLPQRLPGNPIEEIRNSIGAYLAALLAAFMAVIVVGSLALGVIRFVPTLVGGNASLRGALTPP